MTVLVNDSDFTLHVGDVHEQLALLPDGSVDCCVTSPPYWGLRDYGTGSWEGGGETCDHKDPSKVLGNTRRNLAEAANRADGGNRVAENRADHNGEQFAQYAEGCGKCGARRVDRQLGLEPTPDEYVQNMVAVFREVRRVLADHGTCWLNLGDSYVGGNQGGTTRNLDLPSPPAGWTNRVQRSDVNMAAAGLKPKDLVGIPWRVAFALQADGWYLRADIVWSKSNPMPESVTDRPTKAHEYVFLLSKRPRYFFDQEAVREPHAPGSFDHHARYHSSGGSGYRNKNSEHRMGNGHTGLGALPNGPNPSGRNVRSVWEIATQPYAEAHFATYPEELVRRCVLAGCPERVCQSCGKPSERIVEASYDARGRTTSGPRSLAQRYETAGFAQRLEKSVSTVGWSDCGHNTWRPGIVLDPFLGSGTTALVARKHGRRCVGIELNPEYAQLAVRRNAQQTIFAEGAA